MSLGVGLLVPRRLPRSPLWAVLRRDSRIRIVFELHDVHRLNEVPRPDVIVAALDLGVSLRTVVRVLKVRLPGVPIVMLDDVGDAARAQRARNMGVAAVLTERTPPHRFIARLFDLARASDPAPDRPDRRLVESLTPREWDILPYIAQRYSAKEIAEELTISYSTVRTHLRNIYAKCGVGSRRQAAYVAETLLRERYGLGDNRSEEVAGGDELRGRDGGPDAESERVQVHAGSGGHRGARRVVHEQGTGAGPSAGGETF